MKCKTQFWSVQNFIHYLMLGRVAMLELIKRIRVFLPPNRARIWACILALAASPTYYSCRDHVCMCGHLKHPPYPINDYIGDAFWIVCLSLAFGLALLSNLRWRALLCVFISILFFTRYWLVRFNIAEPAVLPFEMFYAELPVQAAMCFYAVVGLLGFRIKEEMQEVDLN